MTKKEHLEYCNQCLNRKFDAQGGLICGLTGRIPDFEGTCEYFNLDESVKGGVDESLILSGEEGVSVLTKKSVDQLKIHQDFTYALVGGLLAAIISSLIWAFLTVLTKYQIGFMAIGVGLFVGFSVRFFGAGIDKKFGYLGASLALIGCLSGNLFSQVGFIAQEYSFGYFETLTYLNVGLIIEILIDSFSPIDLFFYGIAVYEGYKFAFRGVSETEIQKLNSGKSEGYPSYSNLRMPLVFVSFLFIGLFFFKISRGVNGFTTYLYESGNKMSEGELQRSKEHGKWTYWYENGITQLICFYSNGIPDSLWQWFDESGNLIRSGNYKKGLEHGIWLEYYENGMVSDSGSYINGRLDGEWKYMFENGNLMQKINLQNDIGTGVWETYHENGRLSSKGEMVESNPAGLWTNYFDNGQIESYILYTPENKTIIENVWDKEGNQLVVNGYGHFKKYTDSGQLLMEGQVENGLKVGKWFAYFEDGRLKEEGIYENEIYRITHSWLITGEQNVMDGYGFYISYLPDGESLSETGHIEEGLKEGTWEVYNELPDNMYEEQNYIKGKLNGIQKVFYESGQLYSSGTMVDEKREGEWIWYHENGNKSSKVKFKNDRKEGKQIMWSETGIKLKEEMYKNGSLIGVKLF